jgi:hypothetical protein
MTFNIIQARCRTDLIVPAIQVAATYLTTQVLRNLGKYTVSPQTTVLVSVVAATVSSFSLSLNKRYVPYASLPVGIAAGLAAHRFFYPDIPFRRLLDWKGLLIIGTVLASVKFLTVYLSNKRHH